MLVTAFSDVLTMNFFWMVRDEGSWLDIGSSISHFCIASLLCVFVACLELLSEVFVSGVLVGDGAGDGDSHGNDSENRNRKNEDGNKIGISHAQVPDAVIPRENAPENGPKGQEITNGDLTNDNSNSNSHGEEENISITNN